ncbi:hypothetical protein UT300005_17020 [Clostridium sp. CTA-5]
MITPPIIEKGPKIETFPDNSKVQSLRDSILWMAGEADWLVGKDGKVN